MRRPDAHSTDTALVFINAWINNLSLSLAAKAKRVQYPQDWRVKAKNSRQTEQDTRRINSDYNKPHHHRQNHHKGDFAAKIDFFKAGIGLNIILWLIASALLPILFPL